MRTLVAFALAALAVAGVGMHVQSGEAATVEAAQRRLADKVPADVARPDRYGNARNVQPTASGVQTGRALVQMEIPRFGAGWSWTALEGTRVPQIDRGPGHYTGTALPGERGNAAFAGHRAGHGDPFIDFDLLRPGDPVRFRQGDTTWVYRIDSTPKIIDVDDGWVLDPLPGRRLTLTTCYPKYGSARRMFVRGTLERTRT